MRHLALVVGLVVAGCGTDVVVDDTDDLIASSVRLPTYREGEPRQCQVTTEPMELHRVDFAWAPGVSVPADASVLARAFVDPSPTEDAADACEASELRWESMVGDGTAFAPPEPLLLDTSRFEYEAVFTCPSCSAAEPAPELVITLHYRPHAG